MSSRLEAARKKRADRAARKDASGYAQGNTADTAEADRCVYAQGYRERAATTGELQDGRKAKTGAVLARLFAKAAPLMAAAALPPRPRQHRSQG